MNWCVYICYDSKEILYIGHGKLGREKHCNSGVSHVYELNKKHFQSEDLKTKVYKKFNSKREASDFEEILISEVIPKFNKASKSKAKWEANSDWLLYSQKNLSSIDLFNELSNNTI